MNRFILLKSVKKVETDNNKETEVVHYQIKGVPNYISGVYMLLEDLIVYHSKHYDLFKIDQTALSLSLTVEGDFIFNKDTSFRELLKKIIKTNSLIDVELNIGLDQELLDPSIKEEIEDLTFLLTSIMQREYNKAKNQINTSKRNFH